MERSTDGAGSLEQWATMFQPPDEQELLLYDGPLPEMGFHKDVTISVSDVTEMPGERKGQTLRDAALDALNPRTKPEGVVERHVDERRHR
jgi:hypothetical protein